MAINFKDFDQVNDVIEVDPSRGNTAFLQRGKDIYLPKDLGSIIDATLKTIGLNGLFSGDGIFCRIMRVDQPKWQKGRIKLTLEFIPDETSQDELSSIRNQNID